VASRNYEPDSGAYFISLLHNYFRTPSLFAPERLLNETVVHDAVAATIRTWKIEQRHEERSPYRWAAVACAVSVGKSSGCPVTIACQRFVPVVATACIQVC
jgi:meiotically up-regulated gene 157 (Mug157) protein